jgi:ubiquinol-cytochrome c reductase cytochrome b subunit
MRGRDASHQSDSRPRRPASRTTLGETLRNLLDGRPEGFSAWARTTAALPAFLLLLQIFTGLLLAFYYVPSSESAHATVAFVEKIIGGGSWVRALHLYASQLLPAALVLHLLQSFWRGAHRRKPFGWLASILLLALVLANGATGYTLLWDARAFYSTRVAEGLAGGLPLVGAWARAWLTGGGELSTLTLSRFYALHVLVVPALVLLVVVARLFVLREPAAQETHDSDGRDLSWLPAQLARNALVVGALCAGLSLYAARFPAPLGPEASAAAPGYLPRPGAQFLWLFQLLKYFEATSASLVAVLLPALLLGLLALLPFLPERAGKGRRLKAARALGASVFALLFLLVALFTTLARLEDRRDPRVREQLSKQSRQEEEFRRAPFEPLPARPTTPGKDETARTAAGAQPATHAPPPEAYSRNCAKCHGAAGEGKSIYPPLVGISARPQRTVEDIVRILNDPQSYNLERRMPSFARKLSEEEKRAVAEWVASLR